MLLLFPRREKRKMSGSLSKSLRSSPSFTKMVEQEMMSSAISTTSTTRPAATTVAQEKQGIVVAILGSDDSERGRAGATASLRRTLSADMSSKKWLAQNGFYSPVKKIASSEEHSLPALNSFSSSKEEEKEEDTNYRGQFDIWTSIQEQNKKNKKEIEKLSGEFDIWSSILSQKKKDIESSKSLPPPYIHPLVKRSASSLSEKSLEICTESLGSETGSDGFSSESSSDVETDHKEDKEEEQQQEEKQVLTDRDQEECRPVKFKYCTAGRKSAARSFPPPLPSLSHNDGSPMLRMQTRHDNGRLVMEAVSVPSQKNFAAQRRDGRLVLTFVTSTIADDDYVVAPSIEEVKEEETEEFEEHFVDFENKSESQIDPGKEEEEEEEEEESENRVKRIEIEAEEDAVVPKVLSTRLINFHRLALMVNKPIGLPNRNISTTAWLNNKLNEGEEEEEEEEDAAPVIAQSLPARLRPVRRLPQVVANVSATGTAAVTTAATCFNTYVYFWRRAKPTVTAAGIKNITNGSINDNKLIVSKSQMTNDNCLGNYQQQQLVVLRGNKEDCLVPLLQGCKEPRRTLFWEPFCIATS